ncbi:hypothetical protein [Lactococcus lactis]
MKVKNLLMAVTTVATLGAIGTVSAQASAASSKPVYRLYNHNTGEHFYTENTYERDSLKRVGWNDEGLGWQAATSGTPVYRVYNPNARGGDHYYTMSKYEAQSLVNVGWRWDNNGKAAFYSGGSVNLYVAYNPNAYSGSHNYTINSYEQNSLLGKGWKYGKVSWKTMGASDINNGGNSGGNNGGGNNGGNVTPPKPTLPAGMSPKAPNQNTLNQMPAKASAGLSAAEIKKITGVSSYEGVQNIAYDDGMGAISYLFGSGMVDLKQMVANGTSAKESISIFVSIFGAGNGPLTIKMVNAVIDYAGLPASNHVTKTDYPFLPEQ